MRMLIGAALLLAAAQPASAATYFATIKGTVTSKFDTWLTAPGATSPIKVGETITATLSWNTGSSVSEMLARRLGGFGADRTSFQIGEFVWTSAGHTLADGAPQTISGPNDPLAQFESTMDDAKGAGDLKVTGYDFEIGDFGYDLYTGPGYSGTFDIATLSVLMDGTPMLTRQALVPFAPVPEPATWAMMICGFGLAGMRVRNRRPRRAAICA